MNHKQRLELAQESLLGLSIGDALGESFFGEREAVLNSIEEREIPSTTWEFTDDTVMSIAVYEQLEKLGGINQNDLSTSFVRNHNLDANRGYGSTARRILREIDQGGDWRAISSAVFDGMGSMGNGAAMRVSSIGAYFWDDFEKVKSETKLSAEITHTNIEAVTGAMAVSLAASIATQNRLHHKSVEGNEFIQLILAHLPECDTTSKINKSLSVPKSYNIESVKSILGDGSRILAQDTVPVSLWCAAHYMASYEEALWKAVSILGDRDTIGAIVGGIVIMSAGKETVPQHWINSVEKYDLSKFRTQQP